MRIDAVIIDAEFRMESAYSEYGHYICLRFVDESPTLNKLKGFIQELSQFDDVKLDRQKKQNMLKSVKANLVKLNKIHL